MPMGDPPVTAATATGITGSTPNGMINKHTFAAWLCVLLCVAVVSADDPDDDANWQRIIDAIERDDDDESWKRAVDVVELDEEGRDRQREIDRAIVGGTAVLVDQGELQFTIGASFEEEDDQETVELFAEIEYGVTDWLEVGIQVPYLFVDAKTSDENDVDGLSDITLSFSLAMLVEYPFLVSFTLDTNVTNGNEKRSDQLGETTMIWEPSIAVEVALGDAELVLEVGGEFAEGISVFNYEATLAVPFGEIIPSIGIEGSLDGREKTLSVVPGIGLPITENIELAIEVPIGLTHFTANWQVAFELTFEF